MLLDMSCWEVFPPSFYRTHTEEEIREARGAADRELDELLKRINERRKKNGQQGKYI